MNLFAQMYRSMSLAVSGVAFIFSVFSSIAHANALFYIGYNYSEGMQRVQAHSQVNAGGRYVTAQLDGSKVLPLTEVDVFVLVGQ